MIAKIVSRLAGMFSRRSLENPRVPLRDAGDYISLPDGAVDRNRSLTYAAVYRAAAIIAGDVARLPLYVYRHEGQADRARDVRHPAYHLLRRNANAFVTAFQLKESLMIDAQLEGNGYAYIARNGGGEPLELIRIPPSQCYCVLENGVKKYAVQVRGTWRSEQAENILHIRNIGDDLAGYSVLKLASESLNGGLSARKYGAAFYKNGARASGVLMTPGHMPPEVADKLKKDFEKKHTGIDRVGRTILLEDGVKFLPLTLSQDEAQFLETRLFENREVALWFGVPPHRLGDPNRTSYASLEQENASYLDSSLDAWLCRWEEECFAKLLTVEQQQTESHWLEFLRQALVRADMGTRYSAYAIARNWGWLSINDVRRLENLPSIGDPGDVYLQPLNMTAAGSPPPEGAGEASAASSQQAIEGRGETDARTEAAWQVGRDTLRRMACRLGAAARRRAKLPQAFRSDLAGWCEVEAGEHRRTIEEAVGPVSVLLAGADVRAAVATGLLAEWRQRLTLVGSRTDAASFAAEVDRVMTGFETDAAGDLAERLIHANDKE